MSSKRQATSNLNHDNWDQEEEPEDRGTYKTAPADELKARVIKKATRRTTNAGGSDADESAGTSAGVFSGFSGFGKPAAAGSNTGTSPFSFLSNLPTSIATITDAFAKSPSTTSTPLAKQFSLQTAIKELPSSSTNSISANQASPIATTSIFANSTVFQQTNSAMTSVPMFKADVPVDNPFTDNCTQEYCDNVAELNKQLIKWIQENLDKNPKCILLPVFASYEEHLKDLLEKAKPKAQVSTSSIFAITSTTTITTTSGSFFFGKPADSTSQLPMFGKRPNCTVTSGGTTTAVTTPIFSFSNMEKSPTKSEATTSSTPPASIFGFGAKPSPATTTTDTIKPIFFNFGTSTAAAADSAASIATSSSKTNGFSFGLKADDKPSTSGFTGFSKPTSESIIPAASGFSFAAEAAKFSFGNVNPTSTSATSSYDNEANGAEDEEDRPPKVEFKQVVEEDASFSKRCKVFVKKDNDFADRGVGTLYLKPVKDSEKTQMLVRADTNLGNILINLILSEGLPCQRMGKNNVMMVCVPTPEESKPTSILLRVKTAEEADELLEKIKKHTV